MFKAMFKFTEGLVIGAIGGYVAGLLCAPKSGKELREEISEHSEQLYERASQKIDDLTDATVYKMQDVQTRATDAVHDMQSKTTHAMHDLQTQAEQLIHQAATNVRDTRKRIADKFDTAMTQAANSLVDENEIIGG